MERQHVLFACGVGAGSAALGGIGGYLLAAHRLQRRFERDLADVKAHYGARAEASDRDGLLGHFERVPAVGDRRLAGQYADSAAGTRRSTSDSDAVHDGSRGAQGDDQGTEQPELAGDGQADGADEDSHGEDGSSDEAGDETAGDEDAAELPSHSGEPDRRGPGPYVISEAEFFDEQEHYQKLSIMYFQKDGVLVDDKDAPIPDQRNTVGADIAKKFGNDPDNPHIVYIRNDKLEVDFEVALDFDAYSSKILGYGNPNPKTRRQPGSG